MTNEEAKEQLKQIPIHDGVSDNYLKTIYEAIDIAIKALEQQPCEDCISRQAAKKALEDRFMELQKRHDDTRYETNYCLNTILELPSVTPKVKTGKWYSTTIQGEIDGQIIKAFVCSECGAISVFRMGDGNIVNGDLCPNCGAKMQEVENDTN